MLAILDCIALMQNLYIFAWSTLRNKLEVTKGVFVFIKCISSILQNHIKDVSSPAQVEQKDASYEQYY